MRRRDATRRVVLTWWRSGCRARVLFSPRGRGLGLRSLLLRMPPDLQPITAPADYEKWRQQRAEAMDSGKEIAYCGQPAHPA